MVAESSGCHSETLSRLFVWVLPLNSGGPEEAAKFSERLPSLSMSHSTQNRGEVHIVYFAIYCYRISMSLAFLVNAGSCDQKNAVTGNSARYLYQNELFKWAYGCAQIIRLPFRVDTSAWHGTYCRKPGKGATVYENWVRFFAIRWKLGSDNV